LYVNSDIGATESGWWQFWHFFWRMGAMSLLKVTSPTTGAFGAAPISTTPTVTLAAASPKTFLPNVIEDNSFSVWLLTFYIKTAVIF
jgi:hypothetical protein